MATLNRLLAALSPWPVALATACAGVPAAAPAPAREAAAVVAEAGYDPGLGLATFDSAWHRVRANHYDTTYGGLDWNAVRAELRPRAEAARTAAELRRIIGDMIGRLGVSHYTLIPRELSEAMNPAQRSGQGGGPGDAGLELRLAGDELVAWRVAPGRAAAAAGMRPGMRVLRIDAFDATAALERVRALPKGHERHIALTRYLYAVNALVRGSTGDTVKVVAATGADSVRFALVLQEEPGELVRLGNLPASLVRVTSRLEKTPEGCVGVVAFNIWMGPVAAQVDRAIDEFRACRGIVLDLRGNPGGVAGMVMGIGGHFVDSTRALGTMHMRGNTLRYVVNPRRVNTRGEPVPVYAGRLAIVVDIMSASTSEIFAAGLQALGRARVFGEVSAGQALPALAGRMPNGDVLLHAVADYTVIDGTRVEGRGVVPDEVIPLTAAAAQAGRDEALEAALRWIRAPQP